MNNEAATEMNAEINANTIRDWLIENTAKIIGVSASSIDTSKSFDKYGIDSAAVLGLTGDLEDWCGFEIDPTLAYDYPTIDALAEFVASEIK